MKATTTPPRAPAPTAGDSPKRRPPKKDKLPEHPAVPVPLRPAWPFAISPSRLRILRKEDIDLVNYTIEAMVGNREHEARERALAQQQQRSTGGAKIYQFRPRASQTRHSEWRCRPSEGGGA